MSWGKSEKQIYRKGFFKGLYHKKDQARRKEFLRQDPDYLAAERAAAYEASKFDLSNKERGQRHLANIRRAKKDKKFAGELRSDFLTQDEKQRLRKQRKLDERRSHSSKKMTANSSRKPVYDYSKDFDFDSRGRIKGGYTPDGFFEPD